MLEHDNVLPCLGFALVDGIPALVSYWMENGTLTDFLSQNKDADILSLVSKKENRLCFSNMISFPYDTNRRYK